MRTPSTGKTVMKNVSLAVCVPSLTVTVMSEIPAWAVAGVIDSVRLVPVPTITILLLGINVVFVDVVVTVRLFGVSASVTVNAIPVNAVFVGVTWLAMSEIDGAPTRTVNVAVALAPLLSVTVMPTTAVPC
jgi:hypothetical protein